MEAEVNGEGRSGGGSGGRECVALVSRLRPLWSDSRLVPLTNTLYRL